MTLVVPLITPVAWRTRLFRLHTKGARKGLSVEFRQMLTKQKNEKILVFANFVRQKGGEMGNSECAMWNEQEVGRPDEGWERRNRGFPGTSSRGNRSHSLKASCDPSVRWAWRDPGPGSFPSPGKSRWARTGKRCGRDGRRYPPSPELRRGRQGDGYRRGPSIRQLLCLTLLA